MYTSHTSPTAETTPRPTATTSDVSKTPATRPSPYSGAHPEPDRYDQWRLKDPGRWLLHGHTHDENQRLHNGHQIHVGIEAWGRPVNKDELTRLIETAET